MPTIKKQNLKNGVFIAFLKYYENWVWFPGFQKIPLMIFLFQYPALPQAAGVQSVCGG
jgi:hypothetical protein